MESAAASVRFAPIAAKLGRGLPKMCRNQRRITEMRRP